MSIRLMKLRFFTALIVFFGVGCQFLNFTPGVPTQTKMEGVWKVTEATDVSSNTSILNSINFPVTAFKLSTTNGVLSTAGPMFMYIVYGPSAFANVVGKVDAAFDYAHLNTTDGEWFIDTGNVDNFTIEMKLSLPGASTIETLLQVLGVQNTYLQGIYKHIIYHKFENVKVSFPNGGDSVMVWEFDNSTTALYNTKDSQGNYVLWNGWPTSGFSKCKFTLQKQASDIVDIVKAATQQ
jgi:hypothetical protein